MKAKGPKTYLTLTNAVRVFGPGCFLYSVRVLELRHIRTRPKGGGFWPWVWTEAVELLFYHGSNVNQSHSVKNLELLQQQWSPGDAVVFRHSGWLIVGRHKSHHFAHMLQQPKVPMQQQSQQNSSNLLLPHSQQSQPLGS